MVNSAPNVASPNLLMQPQLTNVTANDKTEMFKKTVNTLKQQISNVDQVQKDANQSIADLLTGKNEDVTSVVSAVAKADMSFKLLVGVRNKLVEAYKQTMQMNV